MICSMPGCESQFDRKSWNHKFCSSKCKDKYHDQRSPNHQNNNRRRCKAWAEKNRNVTGSNAWLLGAPPFEEYLPGAGVEMNFEPNIILEHKHISALHGAITSLTGEHDSTLPRFSLVPWDNGCGWGLWLADASQAESLSRTCSRVRLGCDRLVRFGNRYRIKSPRVMKRGHRKLRIDAITPVCVRHSTGVGNEYRIHTSPTAGNMLSTLQSMTLRRIGLSLDEECMRVKLVERCTSPSTLTLAGRGGKLKAMRGWVGHVIVDANAPAHWLLEVASRIGFGGRTAFGFGRIAVTPC